MAAWRLAEGLKKLRAQIDERYPLRSRVSDGALGDQAHAARKSDHNPDARGIVTAIDITKDDEHGPSLTLLAHALTTDSRTKYVIYEARIWKARTGEWSAYTGINAHRHHLHVSIKADMADDVHTWTLDVNVPIESYPTLKLGVRGLAVRVLQERLGVQVDGIYGPATELAVRRLQETHGLDVDGVCGPATWRVIVAPSSPPAAA